MNLAPIFIYGLPLLLLITVGLAGSTRRLGFWWTIALSIVLTPIGGFLVAVLTGPRRRPEPEPEPERPLAALLAATATATATPTSPLGPSSLRPVPPAPPSE